jgi:AAA ATPase domain
MLFTLKNLGRLEEATIDLGKDLIVLTGPNNTSKTYVAHAIYGFCHDIGWTLRFYMGDPLSSAMKDDGDRSEVDVLAVIEQRLMASIDGMGLLAGESLPQVLGAPKSFAPSAQIQVSFTGDEIDAAKASIREQEDHREVKGEETVVDKTPGTGVWRFTRIGILAGKDAANGSEWGSLLALHQIPVIVLGNVIVRAFFNGLASPHIITAERSAVEIFSRELAVKRFDPSSPDEPPPRYPLALTESLKEAQLLASVRNATSPYAPEADRLEREILEGRIEIGTYGETLFIPAGTTERLGVNLASSSVKALAGLSLFLRHRAQKGHFLIIDEPELNLHPHNQRLVARLLARLARSGLKVMISTHSDYILRELNNLIMLSRDKDGQLRKKHGYDEDEILRPERVGAYAFDGAHGRPIELGPAGIDVEAIDKDIKELNRSSRDIYWALEDEHEA